MDMGLLVEDTEDNWRLLLQMVDSDNPDRSPVQSIARMVGVDGERLLRVTLRQQRKERV